MSPTRTGIVWSSTLIRELRIKVDDHTIPVLVGDMASTHAPGDFTLVYLVYNTISNLLNQSEQVACFRNAAREVTRGVPEAGDLLGLVQQVGDRVVDQVDKREVSRGVCAGHVSDEDGNRVVVDLGSQLANHRLGQLDPDDGYAALGQRDGHASGADGELEGSASTCELGQSVNGRFQHLGGEHAGARRVVCPSSGHVPDVFLSHVSHLGSEGPGRSSGFPAPGAEERPPPSPARGRTAFRVCPAFRRSNPSGGERTGSLGALTCGDSLVERVCDGPRGEGDVVADDPE